MSETEAVELAIEGTWLVERVNEHTCGTGKGGYYGAHEPGCGMLPVQDLAKLDGWDELVAYIKAEAQTDPSRCPRATGDRP